MTSFQKIITSNLDKNTGEEIEVKYVYSYFQGK